MSTITITNVPEGMKRDLSIAATAAGTNMTETLRARLPGVIAELEGAAPDREALSNAIQTILAQMDELAGYTRQLRQAVVLYQRRRYNEAEDLMASLDHDTLKRAEAMCDNEGDAL